ncbi:GNAT family N-acetyltransferase [Vibrio sp. SCSIO 43136]|uniref:GNAT family N-acetyltransferase n=1 Tax=Vibrio sp. SCSIO 43136 TaxID=2819101 RepID=UPI0020759A88|nr:GNAT family N-acetyltransferase [Vibrio sp. SCSIO 43136]USD67014.1 GNAT family N-acetyltransferase [Vibrio sp. SCSIO 43136]
MTTDNQTRFTLLPIKPQHDAAMRHIIKTVGAEFGAVGEGFGPSDPEVDAMSRHYLPENKSLYLVALCDEEVIGGCGIAPFGQDSKVCELKKLFLSEKSRGLGAGKALTLACLNFAREQGFESCYLDTLKSMTAAITMYEKLGFEHLSAPMAETEHGGCDVWMLKQFG